MHPLRRESRRSRKYQEKATTMGLFDKKYCDICGEKIGLLGNRKLEDGNLCKDCAKKLSPWFSDRRRSTVADIKGQLAYREENRGRAAQFCITRSFGEGWKVLLDEEHRWFTVTRARDLADANPDILDLDAITGCRMDIDESRTELTREGSDGKEVSYVPPRYEYSYDFYLVISVRHPYFDEMRFSLNASSVDYEPQQLPQRAPMSRAPAGRTMERSKTIIPARVDPEDCAEYRKYRQMGEEICQALDQARSGEEAANDAQETPVTSESAANAAAPWTCPACGGNNQGKFCEYCGSPRP